MHKTKGIPYDPRTGKVLMRLVYCHVLSSTNQEYSLSISKYYKRYMKNHLSSLSRIRHDKVQLRFSPTNPLNIQLSFSSKWGIHRRRNTYTIHPLSEIISSLPLFSRIPHVYHASTIVLCRDGEIVYSFTSTQHGNIITFHDEIVPPIALFITYCLHIEKVINIPYCHEVTNYSVCFS